MPSKRPSDALRPAAAAIAWERPESLESFGKALRQVRESQGLTLDQLAQATGISKPYLSNIETARAPGPPSAEKLSLIAKALQLPPKQLLAGGDWLRTPLSIRAAIGGEAPRRADGSINLDTLVSAKAPPQASKGLLPVRNVPLINRVPAGNPGEFTDLNYPAGIADSYVPAPDLPETPVTAAFALRVTGDSMTPEYQPGDLIIVGPGTPADGQDCVVRLGELDNFATTFKRIYFENEGDTATSIRLVPLNPAHPTRTLPLDQVTGIYPLLYRLVPPAPPAAPIVQAPEPEPYSFTSRVSIEHD